jgi:hypothetical protein
MYCATAPWKTALIYAEGLPLFFKEDEIIIIIIIIIIM